MTSWPYDKITDHKDRGDSRWTSQYSDAERLKGWTRVWSGRIQQLEDAAYTLLTDRWVDDAAGQQLDEIGEIVGEPRLGRTDEDYKFAIDTRISINRSGGEPERIIEYLRRITGASQVIFKEIYPAKAEIFVQGELSDDQAQSLRDLIPAAVGRIFVTESGDELLPFGYNELDQDSYIDRDGFGELGMHDLELDDGDTIELSDGSTLAFTDKEDPVLPDEGGIYSELYEV
jgi:hypothetical protein